MDLPTRGRVALLVLALVIGFVALGCGGEATEPSGTPELVMFDLERVKSAFGDRCRQPEVADELLCAHVNVASLTADREGGLHVPTDLGPESISDDAVAICDTIRFGHFDSAGRDLGYVFIAILARNGKVVMICTIPPEGQGEQGSLGL